MTVWEDDRERFHEWHALVAGGHMPIAVDEAGNKVNVAPHHFECACREQCPLSENLHRAWQLGRSVAFLDE